MLKEEKKGPGRPKKRRGMPGINLTKSFNWLLENYPHGPGMVNRFKKATVSGRLRDAQYGIKPLFKAKVLNTGHLGIKFTPAGLYFFLVRLSVLVDPEEKFGTWDFSTKKRPGYIVHGTNGSVKFYISSKNMLTTQIKVEKYVKGKKKGETTFSVGQMLPKKILKYFTGS